MACAVNGTCFGRRRLPEAIGVTELHHSGYLRERAVYARCSQAGAHRRRVWPAKAVSAEILIRRAQTYSTTGINVL